MASLDTQAATMRLLARRAFCSRGSWSCDCRVATWHLAPAGGPAKMASLEGANCSQPNEEPNNCLQAVCDINKANSPGFCSHSQNAALEEYAYSTDIGAVLLCRAYRRHPITDQIVTNPSLVSSSKPLSVERHFFHLRIMSLQNSRDDSICNESG